jgi:hypothetical protein
LSKELFIQQHNFVDLKKAALPLWIWLSKGVFYSEEEKSI